MPKFKFPNSQIFLSIEMEEAFSVKLLTENLRFCLREKLNKTRAALIRNIVKSSSTFIRISGSFLKNSVSRLGKYYILGRTRGTRGVDKQVLLVSNTVEGTRGLRNSRKILQKTHLSLKAVFPTFKLTQNCHINMNISFFLKNWLFNPELGSPFSLTACWA